MLKKGKLLQKPNLLKICLTQIAFKEKLLCSLYVLLSDLHLKIDMALSGSLKFTNQISWSSYGRNYIEQKNLIHYEHQLIIQSPKQRDNFILLCGKK